MKTSKIDKLGRVVIPIQYRQALHIKENDTLLFAMENGGVVIRPSCTACKLCGETIGPQGKMMLCAACIQRIKEL